MSFGGPLWSVSPADFQMSNLGDNNCVGAFFELDTGSSAPAWIVGDTFLKNVYSVFRFNPPSVGFASLSQEALSMNGGDLPVPSPTIGSVIATATSQMSDRTKSSSASRLSLSLGMVAAVASVLCGGLFVL
jgi:cathepsin D